MVAFELEQLGDSEFLGLVIREEARGAKRTSWFFQERSSFRRRRLTSLCRSPRWMELVQLELLREFLRRRVVLLRVLVQAQDEDQLRLLVRLLRAIVALRERPDRNWDATFLRVVALLDSRRDVEARHSACVFPLEEQAFLRLW